MSFRLGVHCMLQFKRLSNLNTTKKLAKKPTFVNIIFISLKPKHQFLVETHKNKLKTNDWKFKSIIKLVHVKAKQKCVSFYSYY